MGGGIYRRGDGGLRPQGRGVDRARHEGTRLYTYEGSFTCHFFEGEEGSEEEIQNVKY